MKRTMFMTVLLVLAMVFFSAASAFAQNVIDININTLLNEIDSNSARADQLYQGKTIRTSGRVYSISGNLVLMVSGNNEWNWLFVQFNESERAKIINLQKGQMITFRGVYDGGAISGLRRAVLEPGVNAAPAGADAANTRGNEYYKNSNWDRAIAEYTEAIRIDQNNAIYYYNRGLAYNNKGNYDRAIADLTQAIRLDPNDAEIYFWRGWVYNEKGDYDRAITDFTQAIRLDPNDDSAYNNRGFAYYRKGNYTQARADANKALQINSNNQNAKDLSTELRQKGY